MNLNPTPLKTLRHKKGWRLSHLCAELKRKETPISWPTLVMIDNGFRAKVKRDENGKIISRKRQKYKPSRHILAALAKFFKVKPDAIYSDRSKN